MQVSKASLIKVIAGLVVGAFLYHGIGLYNTLSDLKTRESIKHSLVKVMGERGYGSGVVIKTDENGSIILTNKHVCKINEMSEIEWALRHEIPNYKPFRIKKVNEDDNLEYYFTGQVIKVSENTDLCLIHTEERNLSAAPVGNINPDWGDLLHGYSNPRGFEAIPSTGMAMDMVRIWNMLYQQTSVMSAPGSSGSGIFNDSGELVGLVSLGDGMFTYMVPLAHIKAFIIEYQ